MEIKEIEKIEEQENKSVIFVCRHCGNLYWTWQEREKHVRECVKNINLTHSN